MTSFGHRTVKMIKGNVTIDHPEHFSLVTSDEEPLAVLLNPESPFQQLLKKTSSIYSCRGERLSEEVYVKLYIYRLSAYLKPAFFREDMDWKREDFDWKREDMNWKWSDTGLEAGRHWIGNGKMWIASMQISSGNRKIWTAS